MAQQHFLSIPLIILGVLCVPLCLSRVLGDASSNLPHPAHPNKPTSIITAHVVEFDHTKGPASPRLRPIRVLVSANTTQTVANVDDFGAKGDGTDDSEAFGEAWNVVCNSSEGGVIIVPQKRIYHLKPITFSGPCKSDIILQIRGTIKASPHQSDYKKDGRHWLRFDNIQNLLVQGGGSINGNGKIWWRNSCKISKSLPCTDAPTAVTFYECSNLRVEGLRFRNAQQMHVSFQECVNVKALNLIVTAPGNSPNTDGIHVTGTQNILIGNSVIRTGDDCISIVSGSKNVQATDITCGPGHGISIGSLGEGNSEAQVSGVVVNRARLIGTTNGVRIKTWQGGKGYAKNINFQNIQMRNVTNPIIIDQKYCDQDEPCQEQASAVKISNVKYNNIIGTSATETAIRFNCNKGYPCQGITMQNVRLVSEKDGKPRASCVNVETIDSGSVFPSCSSSSSSSSTSSSSSSSGKEN